MTAAGIYMVSLVLGLSVHSATPDKGTADSLNVPESYVQEIQAMKTISVEDAYSNYTSNTAVFVDTRDNAEYREGHIKGAINIPYDKFQQDYPKFKSLLLKNKKIITYCHGTGCGLSVDVAKDLGKRGFTDVYVMTEGWPGWINANLPIAVGREP